MVNDLLELWEEEYRREVLTSRKEIHCLADTVVIFFCGGLRGEELFLTSLKGMLKLWGETIKKKDCLHIMVTLKGRFKGETGEKWHMLPLVDITESGIEVRKWVGR